MRKLLIAFATTAALTVPALAGHSGGHSSGSYSGGGRSVGSMGGYSHASGMSSYSHPSGGYSRMGEHFARDRYHDFRRDRDDFRRVRDRDDFRRDRDDFRHHHRHSFVRGFGFWDYEGCPPGYYLDWRGYCVPVY